MEKYIGIDLGTTYSAVSTIDEYGKPIILKNSMGESLTPSVIYFGDNGEVLVGAEAKEMLLSGEENVAMFFKRNMGNSDFVIEYFNRKYTATDLSAILLRKLKSDAELALCSNVEYAVITVPAYFNDLQRNETIKAAEMAGLKVLRIINEPTAAAITYGVSNTSNQKILVYDLGGGTFDVTVLEIINNSINVLATGGDHELGGKDWDDQILNYVSGLFNDETGSDPLETIESYNDLAFKAEQLKKQLSSSNVATINIAYNGDKGRYQITREKFEELTAALLANTTFKTEEVLAEAGLTWNDINGALLVGGSTKMPKIGEWVENMSGKKPIRGVNVDEAVCMGASIQAYNEMKKRGTVPQFTLGGRQQEIKIQDVMSHSLGIIAVNADATKYINSIIIPKNVSIPSNKTRPYQYNTKTKGDNVLEVYLTQGEVELVEHCMLVAKYEFRNILPTNAKKTIIDISYAYDENGTISISGNQREFGNKLNAVKVSMPDDMTWLYGDPKDQITHTYVFLAIDISGSMAGRPLKKAIEAAQEFVNKIDLTTTSVGLIAFSNQEKVLCHLTQNANDINKAIKHSIEKAYNKWGSGTNGKPLDLCYKELEKLQGNRQIVVLTDGEWFQPDVAIRRSQICKDEDIEIFAVGFGDVDEAFLKKIATSNENAMFTNLDNIVNSFGNIAQVITEGSSGGINFK